MKKFRHFKQSIPTNAKRIPSLDGYWATPEGDIFRKGQSGNPDGRPPKNVSITSLIKEKLDSIDPKTGKTHAELITDKIFAIAMSGNLSAAQEILIRTDGKVIEKHELSGVLIHATPEMLIEAQERLAASQADTNKLLAEYKDNSLLGQSKTAENT